MSNVQVEAIAGALDDTRNGCASLVRACMESPAAEPEPHFVFGRPELADWERELAREIAADDAAEAAVRRELAMGRA